MQGEARLPPDSDQRLIDRLLDLLGKDGVELRPDQLAYFAEDAMGRRSSGETEPEPPLAVVRPASAEQTGSLLALAAEAGVSVVPYGAGTGLMGGARSQSRGLVLDSVRLNRIEVLPTDRLVWAGAGCVLETVDAALRKHGLCLGHDPWTFPVATVGGTLSTNSLGYKGGRYGGMGSQAIALEVALADGNVVRTRAVRRHSVGPDLARLFIGAEGTLGVITAAALEARALPEREGLRAYRFQTFEAGFGAIDEMARLGMRPSLLDYGEEHGSPWPDLASREDEPPLLYLGFEGFSQEVDASLVRAESIIGRWEGVSLGEQLAREFWQRRHVVAQRFLRGRRRERWRSPEIAFDYIHVALPPSKVLAFREVCHRQSAEAGVGLLECGLWTAPDFFSCVLVLPQAQGGQERLNPLIDGLLEAAQDMGGSMEYVHGAGLRLAHLMAREHGEALNVLRRIKQALDPDGLLNPGKLAL
jgi:FAD/FMN-containing dehydrogenase